MNLTTVRRASSSSKREASRPSKRFQANQATDSVTIWAATATSGIWTRCRDSERRSRYSLSRSIRPLRRRPNQSLEFGHIGCARLDHRQDPSELLDGRVLLVHDGDQLWAVTSAGGSAPTAAFNRGVRARRRSSRPTISTVASSPGR